MARPTPRGKRRAGGFTYLAAIFMLAVLAVASARALEVWRTVEQRQRETELLYVGDQYRQAIKQYYQLSSGASPQYPTDLHDLLLDPRATQTRRYLRRLYSDPVTGQDFVPVTVSDATAAGGKRIIGVRSASTQKPIKSGGFAPEDQAFAGAQRYADWIFVYPPTSAP